MSPLPGLVVESLPLGGGCTLYLQSPIVSLLQLSNVMGSASVRVPIPLLPSLRGALLYSQAFVADPQGPVFGLALTNACRLVVGD